MNDFKIHIIIDKSKKLSQHFLWYLLGFTLMLGLPQLVLFPLSMHILGAETFGRFLYVLGIVSMVGLAPSKGLTDAFLRSIAHVEQSKKPLFLRTTFVLAITLISIIVIPAIFLCLYSKFCIDRTSDISVWIIIIVLAFAAQNLTAVGIIDLAFKRRYALRTFWLSLGNILMFAAIPGIFFIGQSGLPIGYSAGHISAFLLLAVFRRKILFSGQMYDLRMAKHIFQTWVILSLSVLFLLCSRYIHRTVLGTCVSYEEVSIFFAGTTILELFILPINVFGLFGYTVLSAHSSAKRFTPRFCYRYLLVAMLLAIFVYGCISVLSKWPVTFFYPEVAGRALHIMPIMSIGISISVFMHVVRPFVMKFSHVRSIFFIGIISFISHIGSALFLIPRFGLMGAAYAYSIGSGIMGLVWLLFFVARFVFYKNIALDILTIHKETVYTE